MFLLLPCVPERVVGAEKNGVQPSFLSQRRCWLTAVSARKANSPGMVTPGVLVFRIARASDQTWLLPVCCSTWMVFGRFSSLHGSLAVLASVCVCTCTCVYVFVCVRVSRSTFLFVREVGRSHEEKLKS